MVSGQPEHLPDQQTYITVDVKPEIVVVCPNNCVDAIKEILEEKPEGKEGDASVPRLPDDIGS